MEVALVGLLFLVCALVALARDRRADYEEPVRLESPRASRAPAALDRAPRRKHHDNEVA